MMSNGNATIERTTLDKIPATKRQSPVASLQRVQFVDVLRAFALFGILFIHSFGEFLTTAGHAALSATDSILTGSVEVLIHDKFYVIFSFLFGWGFYIMHRSAKNKKQPFVKTYLWRLVILLAIGTVHSLLYWDILQIYAVLAPILLLCRNLGKKQLLTISILLFLASTVSFVFREQLWQTLKTLKESGVPIPGKVMQYIVTGRGFMTASMFVLGLFAGKAKAFQHMFDKMHLFKRLAMWSGGAALLSILVLSLDKFNGTSTAGTGTSTMESIYYSFQSLSLACFYVAALVILYSRAALRKVLNLIAPLGKISLTGYLMQSVFIYIFYNLGNGLAMGLSGAMGITVLFYLCQVLFASVWLTRFKMGPVEWLWRLLTYFKWSSPVRKKEALA